MLRPSARMIYSNTDARMRTHALPATALTANGNTVSSNASVAYTIHTTRGLRFRFCQRPMRSDMTLSSICDAFAEQARRPEKQHQNQHDEREYVLVVAAETAAGQVTDVTSAEAFDHAKQHAAEHGAAQIADATEHCRGEGLEPEYKSHVVMRNAVIRADHHARDRSERGANNEGDRDDGVDVDAHQARDRLVLRGRAHRATERCTVHQPFERYH